MNIKLNCPVCGYQEIEGNNCPNCDTDFSLTLMLQHLSPAEKLPPRVKVTTWQLGVAFFVLLLGIGLGVLGSFLFFSLQPYTAIVTAPSPVVISHPSLAPVAIATLESIKPQEPTKYTVKRGDSLTSIAEKFCGQKTSWQVMVKTNPQVKGRENFIDVGEELNEPDCKEGA